MPSLPPPSPDADTRLPLSTICGRRDGTTVRAEGRPGVLVATPRLRLRAGGHRFRVRGVLPQGSPAAFAELLGADGGQVLARASLQTPELDQDLLAELAIHLQHELEGVQLRVIIDVGHQGEIHAIEHKPNRRWLVISNCQTAGLSHALTLQVPHIDVDQSDVWGLHHDLSGWTARLPQYDRLVLSPEVRQFGLTQADEDSRAVWVPGVFFCGYHPDLCYAQADGRMIKGPLDDYHSTIAVAAWGLGLSPRQATRFFCNETYQRVGYYATWNGERDRLIALFDAQGLDIREEFLRWVRRGPFMYSINHPRIDVLMGLARVIARRAGHEPRDAGFSPHDNLAQGAVFPIYPEVAATLGVTGGTYTFKPPGRYDTMNLLEYVEACFAAYALYPREAVRSMSPFLDRVKQHLLESQ